MTAVTAQAVADEEYGGHGLAAGGVPAPRPAGTPDRQPALGTATGPAFLPGAARAVTGGPPALAEGDRSQAARHESGRAARSWPLILLAVPASVAVWSGWVQLGRMTGFGLVRPLPGLWDSLQVNTAVTLPVGVEAYGAFALGTWLSSGGRTSTRTRRYAMWSAIGSLALGMAGQVAYHLMAEAGMTRAPWGITTGVACLPVLLLGMAAALAHMRHADASSHERREAGQRPGPRACVPSGGGQDPACLGAAAAGGQCPGGRAVPGEAASAEADEAEAGRLEVARVTALRLASTGVRVSRRTLRDAGLRGSNAELGALARTISAELSCDDARDQQDP